MIPQFDVFLSYSSVDQPWVIKLKDDLLRYGVSVWLDKDEIRPGNLFSEDLEQALDNCRAVALIVSPEAISSGWVKQEYHRALSLGISRQTSVQIIPVILREAELPGFLQSRKWVDFRDKTVYACYSQNVWKLVWGITGKRPARVLDLVPCLEEVSYPPPPPVRRFWWVIALVALIIGVSICGMVFLPILKDGLHRLLELRATPTPEVLVARVVRTDSEIQIDGLLEEAWLEGDSLTYAVHPAENGSTTATARFLWDDDYLYVGFDVNDTQVEQADPSTPWDSDSVSLLLHDGGIAEHRQSLGEKLGDYREIQLKDWTTKNEPDDRDNGYTIEMQIRWIQKPPPSVIWADLLSVDHDDDPYDLVGDKNFSKLTWDGDGDITSAGGRLLLVDEERSGGEGFVFRISEFGALLQQKLTLGEGSFYTVPLD